MSEEWLRQIVQYGLPTVLLFSFCFIAWQTLWAIGAFVAPLVRDFFAAGKAFLETNIQFLKKMEILGDGLLRQQEAQTELMQRHDTALAQHKEKLDAIHRAVVK